MHGDPHPPGPTTAGHTTRSRPAGGPGLRPARRLLGDKPGNRHAEGTEKEARAQRPAGRCATHAGLAARDRDVPGSGRTAGQEPRHAASTETRCDEPGACVPPTASTETQCDEPRTCVPPTLTDGSPSSDVVARGGGAFGRGWRLRWPQCPVRERGQHRACFPLLSGQAGSGKVPSGPGPLQTPGLLAPRPSTARPPQTSVHDVRNCLCCNKSLRCFCYSSPVF